MYQFNVVGHPGYGKSEFAKHFISDHRNCLVMDVRDEYGPKTKYPGQKIFNLPTDNTLSRSRYIRGDVKEFIQICERKQNTICIFEEATIFFYGRTDRDMRRLLTNRYFSKNIYILLFHFIKAIPPGMETLSDYTIMFHTKDQDYQVERKYPSLYDSFLKAKTFPKGRYLTLKT